MTMLDQPASPEAKALDFLKDLHPVLYRVIELAVEEARLYFVQQGKIMDPYLFPHLVRYKAQQRLLADEYKAIGFSLKTLPNNGLQVGYNGCSLRVWKSEDGLLPQPGQSVAKQEYLLQPLLPEIADSLPVSARLAVLWEVDSACALHRLKLVCPRGHDDQVTDVHWEIDIPHPAASIESVPDSGSVIDDLDDLDVETKASGA